MQAVASPAVVRPSCIELQAQTVDGTQLLTGFCMCVQYLYYFWSANASGYGWPRNVAAAIDVSFRGHNWENLTAHVLMDVLRLCSMCRLRCGPFTASRSDAAG